MIKKIIYLVNEIIIFAIIFNLFSCASDMNVKNFENETPRFVLEELF